jgi:hypothetical protein
LPLRQKREKPENRLRNSAYISAMRYVLAADAVMAVHFLFIAFALLGSFLVLWKRWIVWLHLPALAWGAYIELSGNICPLTPLENHFRELAGQGEYYGGFVTHYLGPIIYPAGFTRGGQHLALAILIAMNLIGYGLALARRRVRTPAVGMRIPRRR